MLPVTVLALHGFGGSGRSWDAVRAAFPPGAPGRAMRWCTPDLRGHGTRSAVRPVTLEAVLEDLEGELDALEPGPVLLTGYSLGGRVALALALRRPDRIAHLVLVASTWGIEDPQLRAERAALDDRLAARLETEGAASFADFWGGLPLWDGDPPAARAAQRAELAAGDPSGLAAALRGLSPGRVPAVRTRLATLGLPLTVVVGARDERYRAIATVLLEGAAQPAGELVLPDAGHGLLREAPTPLAQALGQVARGLEAHG